MAEAQVKNDKKPRKKRSKRVSPEKILIWNRAVSTFGEGTVKEYFFCGNANDLILQCKKFAGMLLEDVTDEEYEKFCDEVEKFKNCVQFEKKERGLNYSMRKHVTQITEMFDEVCEALKEAGL